MPPRIICIVLVAIRQRNTMIAEIVTRKLKASLVPETKNPGTRPGPC